MYIILIIPYYSYNKSQMMSRKFSYIFCSQYYIRDITFSFFLEARVTYITDKAKHYVHFFRNCIKIPFVAIFAIYIKEINSEKNVSFD